MLGGIIIFLIFGTGSSKKQLMYTKTMICHECGRYGGFSIFMTYSYFHIFWLPLFQFHRKYLATATCCGAVYELDNQLGAKIKAGNSEVQITDNDIALVQRGQYQHGTDQQLIKCENCSEEVKSEYDFCPRCGHKLK